MRTRSGRTTVYDIAESAGVTAGTVSRALAGNPLVKRGTREKIREIARKLGYCRTDMPAPRTGKGSPTVGVFCGAGSWLFYNDYFGRIIAGMADAVANDGRRLVLFTAGQASVNFERENIEGGFVMGGRPAGTGNTELAGERNLPLVHVSVDGEVPGHWQLTGGVAGRMELACRRLLDQGHAKIGYIGMSRGSEHNRISIKTLADTVSPYGSWPDPDLIEEFEGPDIYKVENIRVALKRFLCLGVTAMVTADARQATLCLDLLMDMGIQVPAQLSVVSFGPLSEQFHYRKRTLSLVEADLEAEGHRAWSLLREAITGFNARSESIQWAWRSPGRTVQPPRS